MGTLQLLKAICTRAAFGRVSFSLQKIWVWVKNLGYHFNGIFSHKPSIFWGTPQFRTPPNGEPRAKGRFQILREINPNCVAKICPHWRESSQLKAQKPFLVLGTHCFVGQIPHKICLLPHQRLTSVLMCSSMRTLRPNFDAQMLHSNFHLVINPPRFIVFSFVFSFVSCSNPQGIMLSSPSVAQIFTDDRWRIHHGLSQDRHHRRHRCLGERAAALLDRHLDIRIMKRWGFTLWNNGKIMVV